MPWPCVTPAVEAAVDLALDLFCLEELWHFPAGLTRTMSILYPVDSVVQAAAASAAGSFVNASGEA